MDKKENKNREEDHKIQFGRRLAQAMLLTKHTNASLAQKIGVSEPMVKKYVDGQNLPKADVLLKIARATGISTAWLLEEQEDTQTPEDSAEKDLEFLNDMFKFLSAMQRKIVLKQVSETVTKLLEQEEKYLAKKQD
ncbi:TPA: helix-turn-helix domain-containing protein [Citrobacter amalonaticus]|uniref:helix-turn-helix domain-containing protein n=1 Tax=Enterobacteriaceae TaxID=543 RepID=UPI003362B69E|nr:helix-turn-helix domain-containing protein [Enterobacter hormaechei]HCR1152133.1 helix-turn-helix domain-containing protein [Klebsiella aerogenes]